MDYKLTLSDSTATNTFEGAEIPVTTSHIEIATDVQPLSGNVYTDFITQKRAWTRTFKYLDIDIYYQLKGFYDRQFTMFEYPLLTITDDNAVSVPVRMTISDQNIIDNCGTIQDFTVSFRESSQLESPGSS